MMKKVKYFALAILLAGSFTMTSCSDHQAQHHAI